MKRHSRSHPPRSPRLFAEPDRSTEHAQGAHIAQIDGASRGNPGPASYAVLIRRPNGEVLDQLKKEIGQSTNNVAEYYALIAALDYAQAHRIRKLRVRSDSELLVRQMQGRYKVRSADLRPLHDRARKLAAGLAYFSIEHVPREQNIEADRLANEALDRAREKRSFVSSRHSLGGAGAHDETRKAIPKLRDETRPAERRIRARCRHGALHPAEPLDLADGAEVEITIHKTHVG